jgi:DNA-binding GntR family transcriptional regulator
VAAVESTTVRGPGAADKVSAVDVALHEIRRLILSGALPPGKPFATQAVADQLGVSHVPVREALRQLEAQGLVSLSPSRSAVVTPLRSEDLRSIYRMRLWVEPELAAMSAPGRSAVGLARLEDEISETFRRPMTEENWHGHAEFHRQYVLPAAKTWDLRILRVLWDASERFTRLVFDPVEAPEAEVEHNRQRHVELLDAARSRDPSTVRRVLETHLEENEARALQRLETLFSDLDGKP